ncbi:related to dis1-suppressing protein kinase dsk1 [Rhynchosporium agropyri]|uniref:Related to dis1-suppressing protein kinase dsk1 n=1 Tax=Rhynchosporium agropyri TaxID=914238 RepID=A0A1E1LF09_9HELO|nr:related to dis1-suppressing protein kinase dsk1 [Rhynchosporium agropyri]
MAGLLKWARSAVKRAPSLPRQYLNVKSPLIKPSEKVEEENFGLDRYYPARIGDVLSSRYQIVGKLGFGTSSTVWLVRDLEAHRHVAVKIFTHDSQDTDEIAIYKHISQGNKYRLGYRYVRTALDSFELKNRGGRHPCLVHEPLWDSIRTLLERSGRDRLTEDLLRAEIAQPSPRKKAVDREIYVSRTLDMPKSIGEPVLCDFGNAVYGTKVNDEDAYPDVYRCPEVMLHLPWSYSADIWNVGAMRGGRSAEWFDGNGKWLEPDENQPDRLPLLPASSLEAVEENLNGKDKELFLNFIKSMLQWEPEKRKTARELLNDTWLRRSQA